MPLPPNITTCSGPNCTPQGQSIQAMHNQKASMVALKAATSGGGIAVNELPSGFKGPANTQMQAAYIAANKTSNQAAASSVYDNQAKTGGKNRSRKNRSGGKNRSRKNRTIKRRRHWSAKYKKSINCKRPKGFSQRQHCKYGRK
jgi:hypothetical protein